eukprot:6727695-Ditylum_brightwellii.AAC.1
MPSSNHILSTMKPNQKDFNINEALAHCCNWLSSVLALSNCVKIEDKKKKTRCNCMNMYLEGASNLELDGLARYMIHWAGMHQSTQMELLHEWQEVAVFVKHLWRTSVKRPEDRAHKLKGKMADQSSRGKEMIEIHHSIDEYFEHLRQHGLPFANWVIWDETGTNTRDDNVDDVVLPPHISKRSCYVEWCYSQGWKVQYAGTRKSILKNPSNYEMRE